VETTAMLIFVKKNPGDMWRLRRCAIVMQQPVLLSPKFGTKSSHNFTHLPWNVTIVCGINCLACQDNFFVNSSPDLKVGCLHPVACTRSGSGFASNATLFWIV
jgi:hypothetical protein